MRGKKSWRYAAVMLILLALAMWGSRQGEAEGLALTREREALESGMQLKTTVSIEKAALPGTDGVLQSVLENSKLTLLREYPDGRGGSGASTGSFRERRCLTGRECVSAANGWNSPTCSGERLCASTRRRRGLRLLRKAGARRR